MDGINPSSQIKRLTKAAVSSSSLRSFGTYTAAKPPFPRRKKQQQLNGRKNTSNRHQFHSNPRKSTTISTKLRILPFNKHKRKKTQLYHVNRHVVFRFAYWKTVRFFQQRSRETLRALRTFLGKKGHC